MQLRFDIASMRQLQHCGKVKAATGQDRNQTSFGKSQARYHSSSCLTCAAVTICSVAFSNSRKCRSSSMGSRVALSWGGRGWGGEQEGSGGVMRGGAWQGGMRLKRPLVSVAVHATQGR